MWFEISGIHSNGDVKKTAMRKMFGVQMRGPGQRYMARTQLSVEDI